VTVQTVERGLREVVFCSIEIRRREAVDLVDVRLLHHLEETGAHRRRATPRSGAGLPHRWCRGERGFARAGEASEYHQPIARDLHVDVFQVVLARTADRDAAAAVEVPARAILSKRSVMTLAARRSERCRLVFAPKTRGWR